MTKFQIVNLGLVVLFFLLFNKPVSAANSGTFSLSLWIRPDSSVASKAIMAKAEELRLFTNASGQVGCQIKSSYAWQTAAQAASSALAGGTWAYVTCTYDKINLKVYVNAVQVASTALTVSPDETTANLKIGQDDSTGGTYGNFAATFDEFKFYNYGLTLDEVRAEYNHGSALVMGGVTPLDPSQSPSALTNGLVGWWKMDENAGVGTSDSSGLGNNGTLSGSTLPAWTTGKFGSGLNFTGTNSHISIANASSLNVTSQVTVGGWVKYNSVTGRQYILSKGAAYVLSKSDSTNQLNLSIFDGSAWTSVAGATALSASTWYHVMGTYDGQYLRVYLNGVLDGSQAKTGAIGTTANILAIGSDVDEASYMMNGTADDLRVYNRALSKQEVEDLYNWAPGPVASWNFEEATGTTVADGSGNGNTGTLGAGSASPTFVSGKIGKALKFDGNNDYVGIGNTSIGNFGTGDFAVELWFKSTHSGTNSSLIGKYPSTATEGGWDLNMRGDTGSLDIIMRADSTDGTYSREITPLSYNDGRWHHLAAVGVRTGELLKVYVDGSYIGANNQMTMTSGKSISNSKTLLIGTRDLGEYSFDGSIDGVKIFNYARTPAQIAFDYNGGQPVGWWKMDECQGTTINDSSGNGNSGTLTVGATGSQNTVGNCNLGTGSSSPWGNGATGKFNSSLNFDGTDDYVSTSNTVAGSPPYSFCAWLKPTSVAPATSKYVLANGGESGTKYGVYLFLTTGGNWQFGAKNSSGLNGSATAAASTNWAQVCGIWDGTSNANAVKLYVNGSVAGQGTASGSSSPTGNNNLTIANDSGLSNNYDFSGQIDDVRVYNYALSPSQVKNVYNQGSAVRFGPATGTP